MKFLLPYIKPYGNTQVLRAAALGFSSGVPLLLTGSTLNFWLAQEGMTHALLGQFSLVGLPYAFKYLWAPFLDQRRIPFLSDRLGHRRSWAALAQASMIICLLCLGQTNPVVDTLRFAVLAFMAAFCAATQDVSLDAYRIEQLRPEARGQVAATYVLGYRLGMLTSGGGAILCSDFVSWGAVYALMSLCVGINLCLLLLGKELPQEKPDPARAENPGHLSLLTRLIRPFRLFENHQRWPLIILFVMLYRIADNFITPMANPFCLSLGFSKVEIAGIVKVLGFWTSVTGGLIAGGMISRWSIQRSLFTFGALHLITHPLFLIQASLGHDLTFFYIMVTFQSITSGMAMAAFIAYMSQVCTGPYTATQYALLSSLMGVSRTIFPSITGYIVEAFGWHLFFFIVTLIALPGLLIIPYLKEQKGPAALPHIQKQPA